MAVLDFPARLVSVHLDSVCVHAGSGVSTGARRSAGSARLPALAAACGDPHRLPLRHSGRHQHLPLPKPRMLNCSGSSPRNRRRFLGRSVQCAEVRLLQPVTPEPYPSGGYYTSI